MITSTTVSLMPKDKIEDILNIDTHLSGTIRIIITLGTFSLGLSHEQFQDFVDILVKKYREQNPGEINLELGDSLDIKDSL